MKSERVRESILPQITLGPFIHKFSLRILAVVSFRIALQRATICRKEMRDLYLLLGADYPRGKCIEGKEETGKEPSQSVSSTPLVLTCEGEKGI